MCPIRHTTDPPSTAVRSGAYGRRVHQILLAVNAPDNTPPGIFLRLFIFGGLAVVVFVAWFVLRGYRDSGGKK
jgi:hypothetical protein